MIKPGFFSTFFLAFIIFITIFDSVHLELGELEFQYNFDLHCSDGDIDHLLIFSHHFYFLFVRFFSQIIGSCIVLIPTPLLFTL